MSRIQSRLHRWIGPIALLFCVWLSIARPANVKAASASDLNLKTDSVGPRAIESLTKDHVARDYNLAWRGLIDAFNSGSTEPLGGYFVGNARTSIDSAISDQRNIGVHSHYSDPKHTAEAVFYSPEGDVLELHDTVNLHFQLLEGQKVIHDEQLTRRYVVLMTPEADRWVIRQLQEVPEF